MPVSTPHAAGDDTTHRTPRAPLFVVLVFVALVSGVAVADGLADRPGVQTVGCVADPTTVEPGDTVTLDASDSSADIVEFDRDGDGEYEIVDDTDFVANVSYPETGTYEPVARADGETTDSCGTVTVTESPSAALSVSPGSAVAGENVTLDASNSTDPDGVIIEYRWDLDDDGSVDRNTTNPTTESTYSEPGVYVPRVTVVDDAGATSTAERDVIVEGNEPPEPALSVSPQTVTVGQQVTFDASNSTDPDGTIVEYRWDVDGDGSVDRNTTNPTTESVYSESGVYVPRVTVVDDAEAAATAERDVIVEENEPPEPALSVSPRTVTVGQQVTFDASNATDPDGTIVEYRWDLDGDSSVDRNTTNPTTGFSYSQTGAYPVAVTAVDDAGATGTAVDELTVEAENEPPELAISVSPRPGIVGETVTLDASSAVDPDGTIIEYRWDVDGDGSIDTNTSSPTTTHRYQSEGVYVPTVIVVDDDGARRTAETTLDVVRPEPELRCSLEPTTVTAGETVLVDASESTDVSVIGYDTDGDGQYERPEREELVAEVRYEEPGTYAPQVRTEAGEVVTDCGVVTVESTNKPPVARFRPSPVVATVGQQVTFDASNATDPDGQIVTYAWDFDADGTVDRRTGQPRVNHSYPSNGSRVARLTVVDDDGANDTTTRDLRVEPAENETGDSGSDVPLVPAVIGGGGLLGIGGLLWYFFRGGGGAPGGGGGGTPKPKPKRRPKPSRDEEQTVRYETGVFALPTSSGTVSVPVGFEPDLVVCSVLNGARTDPAIDRTAGGSVGLAHHDEGTLHNQCLTVADDARSTDQASCAVADDAVLQLLRHGSEQSPGRVVGRVTDTSGSGFEMVVTVPGDDPLAGGVRVLYRAFRTSADVDLATGFLRTPTEPGTQTVEVGVDADHVSLVAASAVTDTDQLWTTNQGVGLSVGDAVAAGGSVEKAVWGSSAWPETDHTTAAVCDLDRSLSLLYQDGDRVAGRTRASVTALGETLRLQYDRVYNGPHKLGSTARHPVSYLALAGQEMCPAVGAVRFPRADETVTVDCGFEPAMVELVVTDAPVGEEVTGGIGGRPLDVSQGTAIDTGDGLRQYVLHHAVSVDPPAARSGVSVGDSVAGEAGTAAADGGRTDEPAAPAGAGSRAKSTVDPPDDRRDVPTGDGPPSGSSAGGGDADAPVTAPDPTETDDDRAGLWLAQAPDGTILGRDELRVGQLTASGFDLTARKLGTDGRTGEEPRPTVVYRAWPAVGGREAEKSANDTAATEESVGETKSAGSAAESETRTSIND